MKGLGALRVAILHRMDGGIDVLVRSRARLYGTTMQLTGLV
jgi:hypothetical protein